MFKSIIFTLITICLALIANAQPASTGMEEETNIYEKIFAAPLNVKDKQWMTFDELYHQKPLLVAFIFTRCSGICSPFLLQLKDNLQLNANDKSFNILVISFDPRDNLEDMNNMAHRFGLENNPQWIFAVTDSIEQLNQSISFHPIWDSATAQFDHDALLVGINREGYITKKLIGMREKHDIDLLISSVNNVFAPTYRLPNKNSLFSCFNYDPITGKNTPGLGLLFIALPAVLTVLLLIFISHAVRNKLPEEK
ncbi:MAG: SCO family protein [Cyclobacteriaceae bacterium]|nr:SCO family protein [Cyclobacteriaceae bacterium]